MSGDGRAEALLRRIAARTRGGDGDCRVWTGAFNGESYPQLWIDGRMRSVRRVLIELRRGAPLPAAMVAVARCGCRECVNPAHVVMRTHSAQMARSVPRKSADVRVRMALGRRRSAPKLTLARARYIRLAVAGGTPRRALAEEFGISVGMVGQVVRGTVWQEYGSSL